MADLFDQDPVAQVAEAGPALASAISPRWKLLMLHACSFRGLAPAGFIWEHDFSGRSHLFFGPNGCGKSSLLVAVTWCLTGRIYRDDRPPAPPEDVTVYTAAKKATIAGTRALAIKDKFRVLKPPVFPGKIRR